MLAGGEGHHPFWTTPDEFIVHEYRMQTPGFYNDQTFVGRNRNTGGGSTRFLSDACGRCRPLRRLYCGRGGTRVHSTEV